MSVYRESVPNFGLRSSIENSRQRKGFQLQHIGVIVVIPFAAGLYLIAVEEALRIKDARKVTAFRSLFITSG